MNISSVKDCCNCGACYNICPHQAISVDEDSIFYMPRVDAGSCTDCGLCLLHCPVTQKLTGSGPVAAHAGWSWEPKVLQTSSSGGVFRGLAESIMVQGGVVFGAAYTDNCKKVIFSSTEEVALVRLQKSKYVESLVGDSFRKVRTYLTEGRKVLFCGTPCQCAGLRSYLGREYENLLLCDFACGGLPSHQIYQNYLSRLEQRHGAAVQSMDFRPKTHGWRRYAVKVKFNNGKVHNRLGTEDPYLRSFLYGKFTVRDNCLSCRFSDNHLSDLTIADFWLNENHPTLVNDSGVSLILCNSEAGVRALEMIREGYYLEPLDLNDASYNNKKTVTSAEDKQRHEDFLRTYGEFGFDQAYRQVFPFSMKNAIKSWLNRWLRRTCP